MDGRVLDVPWPIRFCIVHFGILPRRPKLSAEAYQKIWTKEGSPTSPTVRALLASEVGTRAAEGHIGKVNRWFAGTQHIDEIEALCVELLKKVFRARYADHRLVASMIGNLAVYTALTQPGDVEATYADIDDLRRDTGFDPKTSLDEGLARWTAWFHDYARRVGA